MRRILLFVTVLAAVLIPACGKRQTSQVIDFQIGERAPNPPLTYNVVDTSWATQLGDGFNVRTPQNRFLMLTLSVTNGGGEEVALPLFALEDSSGKSYMETEKGEGISNWFGLLRTVAPAQTLQGKLVFDVPLASYKLRLPNGGPIGEEKFVIVNIPLRLDGNDPVQAPGLGTGLR